MKQKKALVTVLGLIAILLSAIGLVFFQIRNFDFATSVIPGWHTTIYPPLFVFGLFGWGLKFLLEILFLFLLFTLVKRRLNGHKSDNRTIVPLISLISTYFILQTLIFLYNRAFYSPFDFATTVLPGWHATIYLRWEAFGIITLLIMCMSSLIYGLYKLSSLLIGKILSFVNKNFNIQDTHILAESQNYYVYAVFESVFLKFKNSNRKNIIIGDFYGNPLGALIAKDEKLCIMWGCGLIIYTLEEPFEDYKYDTVSKSWKEFYRHPEKGYWVQNVYFNNQEDEISFVTDSNTGKMTCIFSLNLITFETNKIFN